MPSARLGSASNIFLLAAFVLIALAAEASARETTSTDYFALSPCRVYDTRTPVDDPLRGGPDRRRDIQISGICGVPAEAVAVMVNLTAINAGRTGSLFVYDADLAGAPMPSSTLEVPAGRNRANNAIVGLSADGKIAAELEADFTESDTVDLVVDIAGYFFEEVAGIQIVKLTNGEDANAPPGPPISPGAPVLWEYFVTNTGEVALSNVAVFDDRGVAIACPKTSLSPGESMRCTGNGPAAACPYSNIGTVTGRTPGGTTVSDDDPSHYNGTRQPSIAIIKSTNGQNANTPPGPQIPVGNPVLWTYQVTNNGGIAITNVRVTDDRGVAVSCPKTTLQPGESMTCSGNGTAVACQYSNIGNVTGTTACGSVAAEDPSHYFGTPCS